MMNWFDDCSESVNFELFSLTDADFFEEFTHITSLIALQLNYFAVFLMFNYRTIASKFLFKSTKKTFLIEFFANTLWEEENQMKKKEEWRRLYLDGGERFLSTSLLNTNVDYIGTSLATSTTGRSTIGCTRPGHIGERVSWTKINYILIGHAIEENKWRRTHVHKQISINE